jgi:hypothetical protein
MSSWNFPNDALRDALRDARTILPGGCAVGEKVFFTGTSQTLPHGDKLVHGQQGEVKGLATIESYKGKGMLVRFPGNKGNINCLLDQVRRLRAAAAATSTPTPPCLLRS